jgi:hypothetical protein
MARAGQQATQHAGQQHDRREAELVTVRFEPCAAFSAGDEFGAGCDDCGWLDDDHAPVAEWSRAAA